MAAAALPPPDMGQAGQGNPGAGPGGGFPSPAPAQSDPSAARKLELVRNIVSSSRMLGQMVPGAASVVQQINELVQQLQQKIIGSQPAQEPQAPPV